MKIALLLLLGPFLPAADCNRNGVSDPDDLAAGTSLDCNSNRNPDECDIAAVNFGFVPAGFLEVGPASAVAAGDLDGDRDLDLAASLELEAKIAVALNAGEGNFPETIYFPVAGPASHLIARDLDGDGGLDLALAGSAGVSVIWNDGRAGYGGEVVTSLDRNPVFVESGDLDGDGDLDLVTANDHRQECLSVIFNLGDRRLSAATSYTAGEASRSLAVADLDADGSLDLAVAGRWSGGVALLRNDGRGAFTASGRIEINSVLRSIAGSDLDGDRDVDLAVALGHGTVNLLLNDGTGKFAPGKQIRTELSYGNGDDDLVTGDFDRSGSPDLLLLSRASCAVLLNAGDGTLALQEPVLYPLFLSRGAAAADLRADGAPELAIAGGYGLYLYRNEPVALRADCNGNGTPDDCERDCDCNGLPDDCEIADGKSGDCNRDGIPDNCQQDCDRNGVPDDCEIASGASPDCDRNGIPDGCELSYADCNSNGVPDGCDLAGGSSADCNGDGLLDECEVREVIEIAGRDHLRVPGARACEAIDLDGDGDSDLLASGSDGLWIGWSRGGGRFVSTTWIPPRGGPFSAADFDLDGDLDLCVASRKFACSASSTEITLFRQQAPRDFRPGVIHAPGVEVQGLAAEDLNGDGVPDLAAGISHATWLFAGRGGGTFEAPRAVADHGGVLVLGDLDGDGDPDLVAADLDIDVGYLYLNRGNGSFAPGNAALVGKGGLVASDLDGDGDLDLAGGGGGLNFNDGRGGLESSWEFRQLAFFLRDGKAVAALDADGDGAMDLAFIDHGGIAIYRNDGSRGFTRSAYFSVSPGAEFYLSSADLDRDGRQDLVVADPPANRVSALLNLGGPQSFGTPFYPFPSAIPRTGVAAGDFDGDLDPDLAVAGGPGELTMLANRGDGSFEAGVLVEVEGSPVSLAAADFDGDGDLDLAVADGASPEAFLLQNQGGLAFESGERITVGWNPTFLTAADLDGDQDPDLVTANAGARSLSVALNRGGASFAPSSTFVAGGEPAFVVAGDLDGDRDPDLAAGVADRAAISIFRNDGQGSFVPVSLVEVGGSPRAGAVGDFDGDGALDLAVTLEVSRCSFGCQILGESVILFNRGGGTFTRSIVAEPGYVSESLSAADLDGDGDLDLALPLEWRFDIDLAFVGSEVLLLLNEGDRRFRAEYLGIQLKPQSAIAADLDGVKPLDLVVSSSSGLAVLLRRAGSLSPDRNRDGVPDECASVRFRRGDVNQDGSADLSDAIAVLFQLFAGGAPPDCRKAADWNDDGALAVSDPVFALGFLFLQGPPIPAPARSCGVDLTPDDLSCDSYRECN